MALSLMASNRYASSSKQSRRAYHQFGRSWAVDSNERLLLHSIDLCVDDLLPPSSPCDSLAGANRRSQIVQYCSVITDRRGPHAKCHDTINPSEHYESCLLDACTCDATSPLTCACSSIRAYESLCHQSGVRGLGTVVDQCGVCFGDGSTCLNVGATCYAYGDSHYRTFDNVIYHFQGRCEYTLSRDCVAGNWQVQLKNENRSENAVHWTKFVAIRLAHVGVIRLLGNRLVEVNSKSVSHFPYTVSSGGVFIRQELNLVKVYLSESGVSVSWDGSHHVFVTVPTSARGKVCGLCGQYNMNHTDDLQTRNGTAYFLSSVWGSTSVLSRSLSHKFGVSWTVSDQDRLLLPSGHSCVDKVLPSPHPCDDNARVKAQAEQYCLVLIQADGPYAACYNVINPESDYKSCLYDTCACGGDTRCACDSVRAYETVCGHHGVKRLGSVLDECGVCFGDGSTCMPVGAACQAAGDPHYRTFDGTTYDFQGKCEYVLSKDVEGDFEIHVENDPCGLATCTKAVYVNVPGGASIILQRGPAVQVNGQTARVLPFTDPSRSCRIFRKNGEIHVRLFGSNVLITWDGSSVVRVTVSDNYKSRTRGLCGAYNASSANDLLKLDGTIENADAAGGQRFGVSWAVEGKHRRLLPVDVRCTDAVTPPAHPCKVNPSVEAKAKIFCNFIINTKGPYVNCHNVIDPLHYYNFCVYDICANDGDTVIACQSVRAYEDICRTQGHVVQIGTIFDECGVCFGDASTCADAGATCQASGDPHYVTFDGAGHHFQVIRDLG